MKKIITKIFFVTLLLLPGSVFASCESGSDTSINRYNITWTFDGEYSCGQFANGDYWVLDEGRGVTIVNIDPLSTFLDDRVMHGSMINPTERQVAYDSSQRIADFHADLNVARPGGEDLSAENPLVLNGALSLASSRSHQDAANRPQLLDLSVLTVLTEVPAEGSFRPPYSGDDKTIYWNSSDIRWDILPSLSREDISNLPDLEWLESEIERTWLDHGGGTWYGRELHPINNMPDYGRDMAIISSDIALALLLDYERETVINLMIKYIQLGIDWYGITEYTEEIIDIHTQGGLWMGGGGHGMGRKWPLVFAGLILGDENIRKYIDASNYFIFQEEQQFFFVSQEDVDRERYTADNRPRAPYTVDMIGMAEWGEQHYKQAERDGSNWDASYRSIVSRSILGHVLAAQIMNQRSDWNWEAFFEYFPRWVEHRQSVDEMLSYGAFVDEMWLKYSDYQAPEPQTFRADSNNDSLIDSNDALLILRKALNRSMSGTTWQDSATTGDVNCDGSVTTMDALLTLREHLGLDNSSSGWCGG